MTGHVIREHCPACAVGGYFVCQHKVNDLQDAMLAARKRAEDELRAVADQMAAALRDFKRFYDERDAGLISAVPNGAKADAALAAYERVRT